YATESGDLTQTLRDRSSVLSALPVTSLRFTCSRQSHCLLLATYASGHVTCWYVWGGQCMWRLKEGMDAGGGKVEAQRQTLSLSISPSGERAVTGGSDSAIHLYDLTTQQRLQICRASESLSTLQLHKNGDGWTPVLSLCCEFPSRERDSVHIRRMGQHCSVLGHQAAALGQNVFRTSRVRRRASNRSISQSDSLRFLEEIQHSGVQSNLSGFSQVWDYDSGKKVSEVPQDVMGDSKIYSCQWFGQDRIVAAGGQPNMLKVIDRHSLTVSCTESNGVKAVWLVLCSLQFLCVSVWTVGWSHSSQLRGQSVSIGQKSACQETPPLRALIDVPQL
ncbi:hypothetical protein NFI96_029747, partial [Prochilodus magdalenae]